MGESIDVLGFLLAVCLGLVHIFASKTHWLTRIPPQRWMSIAGGVSIAYIFLDIFPELERAQAEVEHIDGFVIDYLEHHVYLLALVGLAIFYGLEKLALRSRTHHHQTEGKDHTQSTVFWLHIGSFALYNAILGYLLRESETYGLLACFLLFVTLALHFLVNDVGLREHHKHLYDHRGRWVLSAAVVLGWVLGQAIIIDAAAIAAIWALVAGGIILNVLKEELPAERESNFSMFIVGAAVYSVVLLVA